MIVNSTMLLICFIVFIYIMNYFLATCLLYLRQCLDAEDTVLTVEIIN